MTFPCAGASSDPQEAEVAIAAYIEGQMNVHPGPKGHAPEIWTIRERHYRKLQRLK
jgi:hypothetical protein